MKSSYLGGLKFLLVGNGGYVNRGCEAIVRCTMKILRREFGDDILVGVGAFGDQALADKQNELETDPALHHFSLYVERGSRDWWLKQCNWYFHTRFTANHHVLHKYMQDAIIALEIGGDNYTLDYGSPKFFVDMDRHLMRHKIPVALWGASVGPFDANPRVANKMFRHLGGLSGVFLRESESYHYLEQLGLTNLYSMPDPAFLLEPEEPDRARLGFEIPRDAIGINFSPLMARYVVNGNIAAWLELCQKILCHLIDATSRYIVLVPHVTSNDDGNDYVLMKNILEGMPLSYQQFIHLVGPCFSAAETKWIISRCGVFAGARMHSVVAALGCATPAVSFVYSRKAIGLHKEFFNSTEHCIRPGVMIPDCVTEKVEQLLHQKADMRKYLQAKLPEIHERAYAAGQALRELISFRGAISLEALEETTSEKVAIGAAHSE